MHQRPFRAKSVLTREAVSMTAIVDFPAVAHCQFLKSSAYIGVETRLPAFINLVRNGDLLQFRYNFKDYVLGISRDSERAANVSVLFFRKSERSEPLQKLS
jgi:hypothetical protein